MSEYYSTLSGWLIPITKSINDANLDADAILKKFDVNPASVNDPEAYIGIEKLSDVLAYCNQLPGQEDFAIKVAKNFHPGIFHALGYAMLSANSVMNAFERVSQYKRVISNCSNMEVSECEGTFIVNLLVGSYSGSGRKILPRLSTETFLATLLQFGREMAGHALNPKRVTLAYPAPKSSFYLEQFLQCEVEYNAPNNTLIFNLDDVKQRSLGCNPQINQAHIQMLDQFLSRVDKKNLSYIIVDKICEKLPLGAPSQQEIANELGMSLRNLQRKLNEQGTSYKEILENTRKRLTLEYIKQPHLSLSEIGYLVGFSSVANFNRAFRRWVDSTPGEYRSRYLENIVLPSANIHLSPIGI